MLRFSLTYPVGCHSQVLQILEESYVRRYESQVVVAEIQIPKFSAIEELGRDLLDLVPIQVKALQVGEVAYLHGDVGNVVVPQFKASETM